MDLLRTVYSRPDVTTNEDPLDELGTRKRLSQLKSGPNAFESLKDDKMGLSSIL